MKRLKLTAVAFAVAAICAGVAWAQTPTGSYSFVDSATLTQNVATYITCPSSRICPPFVPVDVSGNPVVTTTGNLVPLSGWYASINVGGNLQGWTGVNPAGGVFAGQVDIASVAGTTVKTGAGTAVGAERVTAAQDTTTIAGSAPGTAGTPSANVVTVQGVAAGTGVSTSPATLALWGIAVTSTAVPPVAVYSGVSANGVLTGEVGCDRHVFKHLTNTTDEILQPGIAGQTIKICGALAWFNGSNAIYLENVASTVNTCAAAKTQISGQWQGAAQSVGGFYSARWGGLANTSGNGLCVNNVMTSGTVDLDVWFTQGS